MATTLSKTVKRVTAAVIFERSEMRNITVSLEPVRAGALIGFRLKGRRDIYRLGVESLYQMAIRHHLQKIERLAKKIVKDEKVSIRTARSRARKQLQEDLK